MLLHCWTYYNKTCISIKPLLLNVIKCICVCDLIMANKLNLICGSNQPCLVQVLEYQLHVDVRYSKTHTLAKFAIGNGAL